MKKKTINRVLALAMSGVMAIGLAGCGSSSDSSSSSSSSSSSTSTDSSSTTSTDTSASTSTDSSSDATEADGIEGFTAFADTVTLTIPVYDRGAEGVPAIGENYWEDWIQENFADQYNIQMEFVPITRSDVMTSYNLLAASGDLPTILMEYDYDKNVQWYTDGFLTEIDLDEFAHIAPTYYQTMVDNDSLGYTTLNGETVFVCAERPYWYSTYTYITFYRQDWVDELIELGYTQFEDYGNMGSWTSEQALEVYQAIKDEGIAEYPLGGQMVTGAGVDQNYSYRTFPLDEEDWVMYGDYNIPALGSEANKALLKDANNNYNLGLTNPEYYITDSETAQASFVNGETFSWSAYISSTMDWLEAFYETNPDATLGVAIADASKGSESAYRASNAYGMLIGFSSQATDDEIKAAMMYMEWMSQEENLFTMQWGFEGEHFEYDENGLPVALTYEGSDHTQGYNNNKDYWCVVIESKNAGTIEDTIASISPVGLPQDFTDDIIANYYGQVDVMEAGYVVVDCQFGVAIESVSEYQETLYSLYSEYRDQLTMCDPDEFDALYDELAQKYADAGYGEITAERLAAYESGNTTTLN